LSLHGGTTYDRFTRPHPDRFFKLIQIGIFGLGVVKGHAIYNLMAQNILKS
jgi:hypothetical protein